MNTFVTNNTIIRHYNIAGPDSATMNKYYPKLMLAAVCLGIVVLHTSEALTIAVCDSGWTNKNGRCFKAFKDSTRNWNDAEDKCREKTGADLAKFRNIGDAAQAMTLMGRKCFSLPCSDCF